MSIFDTRTSEVHAYENEVGQAIILLAEPDDADYPLRTLSNDYTWGMLSDLGFSPSGLITGTATFVRTMNDEDGWAHHVFQFAMRYQRRRMQATFRVGTGWEEAPTVSDVLGGMILDYRLTEYESADSLGYEPRRARSIERQIERQTERLRKFINL